MIATPPTRYAHSGDAHIAYQVTGSAPLDVVLVLGGASTSVLWEDQLASRFFRRLTSFSRLVTFDQRGVGRSDPVVPGQPPTLEERVDDLKAVMEAAGLERAALFGTSDGGAVAMTFAATYPEHTTALVLYNTWARLAWAEDYPWGHPPEMLEAGYDLYRSAWGTGFSIQFAAPSLAKQPGMRQSWARHEQATGSPGQAIAVTQMAMGLDIRPILPAVSVPTLVLHTAGNAVSPPEHGHYLADHIPAARYVELPGNDHMIVAGDTEAVLDEVEQFLTGTRLSRDVDRALYTILFVDVVDSTRRIAEIGDRRWAELLERLLAVARAELTTYRGHEVKETGDGLLATFDGPGRAIECALAIVAQAKTLGLEVRAGVHTGECEITPTDIAGMAVHIGARIGALAEPNEVLVSKTVKDLVAGSPHVFVDRGDHELRGVPGEWRLLAVAS
ncbi:MAG TPA: alpha/beta fold hydrolase [Acidimicrobiales bacterium]|nr:alpha/beta fold hydrolase [Acidimicrobiales bacterium]